MPDQSWYDSILNALTPGADDPNAVPYTGPGQNPQPAIPFAAGTSLPSRPVTPSHPWHVGSAGGPFANYGFGMGAGSPLQSISTPPFQLPNGMTMPAAATGAYNNIYDANKAILDRMKGGSPAAAASPPASMGPPAPGGMPIGSPAPAIPPPRPANMPAPAAAPMAGAGPSGGGYNVNGLFANLPNNAFNQSAADMPSTAASPMAGRAPVQGPMAAFAQQPSSPFTMVMRPNAPANNFSARGGGGPDLGTALDLSGYQPGPPPAPPTYNVGYGRSPAAPSTPPPAKTSRAPTKIAPAQSGVDWTLQGLKNRNSFDAPQVGVGPANLSPEAIRHIQAGKGIFGDPRNLF